ncbi:MAG: MBL fold metallo-hydrolase [Oscillospiraceae bacterium]|jgi:Cft2 family RNA processing exonuclease|nr:MBL fold metallo-hydrolase [Oscillospiraceae bacterium]
MKLTIAGGCGEHGRNCFLVNHFGISIILDCGIMLGDKEPYPQLSVEQITECEYLFLTHSHKDHAGAYPWILEQGFKGKVVMTAQTAQQLPFKVDNPILIDELTPPLEAYSLSENVSVTWGRSGHCAGSCWFKVKIDDKTLIYSGDYVEFSLVYTCDYIREQSVDVAIIDNAYGDAEQTPEQYRTELVGLSESLLKIGKNLLFPVPKYGRGLELMLLFNKYLPHVPICCDKYLRSQLRQLHQISEWLKPEAIEELQKIHIRTLHKAFSKTSIIFVSDPQLEKEKSQNLAQLSINRNGAIVITGYADMDTYSKKLLESKPAIFARYPVHMNDAETKRVIGSNSFAIEVPFHR